MDKQRRALMQSAALSLCVSQTFSSTPAQDTSVTESPSDPILDYGNSFICNQASFNAVQFWIESRTTIIDETTAKAHAFYQCASCKSENTFGETDLFYADNYDFLPILGDTRWLIFRRPCRISDVYRTVEEKTWGQPKLMLRFADRPRELNDFSAIRNASAQGWPIVARTEIWNDQTELRAIIEYPVKTMNVSLDKSMYQVDTGPIALPDLTSRPEPMIESLNLAFVAFNAPDFADFVVEQPTPVTVEGRELTEVYHYSNPISMKAKNRLFAVPLPS